MTKWLSLRTNVKQSSQLIINKIKNINLNKEISNEFERRISVFDEIF